VRRCEGLIACLERRYHCNNWRLPLSSQRGVPAAWADKAVYGAPAGEQADDDEAPTRRHRWRVV